MEQKLVSAHSIGENVCFSRNSEDLRYVEALNRGHITSIRFTKAKVFYDIVDDYTGQLITDVDSCWVQPKPKTKGKTLPKAKGNNKKRKIK